MMSRPFAIVLVVCLWTVASAQAPASFAGTWVLNAARSQNLGMMADLQDTLTIAQTPAELVIQDHASLSGQQTTRELHYDLSGKTTTNDGWMGDRNDTVVRWQGPALVATWTAAGAVAGTTVVRTETRTLSADGQTMTVALARGGSSTPPLIMVFEKR